MWGSCPFILGSDWLLFAANTSKGDNFALVLCGQGSVLLILTSPGQNTCAWCEAARGTRSVMARSVTAQEGKVQGPDDGEEQPALDVREPRAPLQPWHPVSSGGGCDGPRALQVRNGHMKVCHPCYYGDSWPQHLGCPTQDQCPDGAEPGALLSFPTHTLTFSQCPSSTIVLDDTLLTLIGAAMAPGQQGGQVSGQAHKWLLSATICDSLFLSLSRAYCVLTTLPVLGRTPPSHSGPGTATQMGSVASSYEGRHATRGLRTQALKLARRGTNPSSSAHQPGTLGSC